MADKRNKTKTMENLEMRDCRWPIGDPRQPGFHFCGARQIEGRPYCELHWRMSFAPLKPRGEQSAPMVPGKVAA